MYLSLTLYLIVTFQDKLDTLSGEKQKIDSINEGIDAKLEAFNDRYNAQLQEFDEIALKDKKIEEKYLLLKSELDRVASERLNLIKKNEALDKEAEEINNNFISLDGERRAIFESDKEIEKECAAIHAEFEKLNMRQESVVNLNEKVEKESNHVMCILFVHQTLVRNKT